MKKRKNNFFTYSVIAIGGATVTLVFLWIMSFVFLTSEVTSKISSKIISKGAVGLTSSLSISDVKLKLPPDLAVLPDLLGKDMRVNINSKTNKLTFLTGGGTNLPLTRKVAKNSKSVFIQIINDYGKYFGMTQRDVSFNKDNTDDLGMHHVQYDQKFSGVPVFGTSVIAHLGKDFSVKSLNAKVVPNVSLDVKPKIAKDKINIVATDAVKNLFGEDSEYKVLSADLNILNKNLLISTEEDNNYLTYKVVVDDPENFRSWTYFIDANSGDVLLKFSNNQTARLYRAIFSCEYADRRHDCSLEADLYFLNDNLEYVDCDGCGGKVEGSRVRVNEDTENIYTYLGKTNKYYSDVFHLIGPDGRGSTGARVSGRLATVALSYINSADCLNAWWNPNDLLFGFCEDTASNLGVIAHEYTHAVMNFKVGHMTYLDQTGAIMEGYADIFAEAVKKYTDGSNDWLSHFTDDTVTRNYANPSSVNYEVPVDDNGNISYENATQILGVPFPDAYNGAGYWHSGVEAPDGCNFDNCGVHVNSTVISHIAYLMSQGGTFNNCQMTGIGLDKVTKIFYQAMNYLGKSPNFVDFYDSITNACFDLYGHGVECQTAKRAMSAAAINPDNNSYGVPSCQADLSGYMIETNVGGAPSVHPDANLSGKEIINNLLHFSP